MWRVLLWLAAGALAIPALTLTVARATDTDNGSMVRIEAFTPLGLPLYAVLLVLLAFGAVRQRGDGRAPLVAALLALVGLALHAWWFSPQLLGDTPEPADGAQRVTVMNANLFEGKADAEEVVDAVRDNDVDILVLEEITPDLLAQMDAAGLAELLPERVGEPDYMVAGTMILANRPLTDHVRLRTTFQGWEAKYGSLTVLGVHPVAPVDPAGWRADHAAILKQAEADHADLIVGDMNATPDHDVMRRLDDAGFRDAGEVSNEGWQPTWPANHVGILPLLPPLVRIDHVLIGDQLASLGTHTVDIDGSDHLALVATVAEAKDADG
jgi:endonuclease/exonuclease/phosphatase family metal-dependent hydrolase